MEPELHIKEVPIEANILHAVANHTMKANREKKNTRVMIKKSKFDQHLDEAILNKVKFVDKEFPPNDDSLNFRIPDREIIWMRAP